MPCENVDNVTKKNPEKTIMLHCVKQEMKHLHYVPKPPLRDCLQMHTTWTENGKPAKITKSTGWTENDAVRVQTKGPNGAHCHNFHLNKGTVKTGAL